MSNLVDKEKLIAAISSLPRPTQEVAAQLSILMSYIHSGELDFHPAEARLPNNDRKSEEWQVETVRKVCAGMVMGKACVKFNQCDFALGTTDNPCSSILSAITARKGMVKKGNVLISGLTNGKRWDDAKPL